MSTLHTELTNLLPRSRVRALRYSYTVRLLTVTLALGVLLLVVHGILLLPSYLYARAEVKQQEAELARIAAAVSSSEDQQVKERVASVQSDIAYLGRLEATPRVSSAVRAIAAVPHPGVTLTNFTFSAPATMTIAGTASTRDALRKFVDALGHLSFVSRADVPISTYAKESDIPFTITLTGSLLP